MKKLPQGFVALEAVPLLIEFPDELPELVVFIPVIVFVFPVFVAVAVVVVAVVVVAAVVVVLYPEVFGTLEEVFDIVVELNVLLLIVELYPLIEQLYCTSKGGKLLHGVLQINPPAKSVTTFGENEPPVESPIPIA